MAIRIDRINVNRRGPLRNDFKLEPGDLNLIYGHNETGKTYIVETIINLLFKTGFKSPAKWNLREWDLGGRIIVSGLEDEPVPFTKTGRKLEQYWEEGSGLPRDLSRLLVVKAGDTVLAEDGEGGVGRGILKDYLSGEGLLDRIADRISSTLQEATVQDRLISGPQRGELKNRTQCENQLRRLNSLLKDVEEDFASGEVWSLWQKMKATESELDVLDKAKCYHAAQLNEQIQTLRRKKDEFPSEEDLANLKSDIGIFNLKNTEFETKSSRLSELEDTSENYKWVSNARNDYSEIISKQSVSDTNSILLAVAFIFFVVAMITGFLGSKTFLVLSGVTALGFFGLYYWKTSNARAKLGESKELDRLKLDFSNRFGSELTNRAVLDVQLEKLKENHFRATTLKEEIDKLNLEINSYKNSITITLKALTGNELLSQEWEDSIGTLRRNIKELESDISSRDLKLASLAVQEEEYLTKYPGIEWDNERYEIITHELEEIEDALKGEMENLEQLKARIRQETGSQSAEWEELFTELRIKRDQANEEYREITADIIAKVQVNAAIEVFREEEDARIADGLKRDELTKPLQALTSGRYNRIKQEEDSGLIFVTVDDEEYPLLETSTGAREQIFLSLRIGFASIVMEGQAAFLILDDAFQHSDWDRRKNMVAYTLNLIENGWQILYFTMDDHIRDLFLEAGGTLGDRFKSLELR